MSINHYAVGDTAPDRPDHAAARTRTADEEQAIRDMLWQRHGYYPAHTEPVAISTDLIERLTA